LRTEVTTPCQDDAPRAGFVPAEAARVVYVDEPIAIPDGQVTTQPSLIARMVAALSLSGTEQVLEVGTGLGFQTAIPGCARP
jgi:protein-L-isoaspartate(D-aspartate) O-methyltransferase